MTVIEDSETEQHFVCHIRPGEPVRAPSSEVGQHPRVPGIGLRCARVHLPSHAPPSIVVGTVTAALLKIIRRRSLLLEVDA